MKKYIFLSSLFFSLSSFASDIIFYQEDYNKDLTFSQSRVSNLLDKKIQNIEIESDIRNITFQEMLDAWKTCKLLTIGGEEYIVLQKEPKLKINTYQNQELVEGNPCYLYGLGPYLLQKKDLQNLPKIEDNVSWVTYNFNTAKYKEHTFITVRFTSHNNPHWSCTFRHPQPFNDLNNRYWHTEYHTNSVLPIRTVNFILQEMNTSF